MEGYGDEVLTLIQARAITNEFGYPMTIQEQRRGVYAQLRSAGRSEFYQARSAGVEIEMIAIIRAEDYAMEREAELYGRRYSILRVYRKDRGFVELTLNDRGKVSHRKH